MASSILPTYNFGSTPFSTTAATNEYNLCGALGGSTDSCGATSTLAGLGAGTISTGTFGANYGAFTPYNSSSMPAQVGAGGNFLTGGSTATVPGGGSFTMPSVTSIAVIVIGVILFGAALYLFGTSSLSNALMSKGK